MDSKGPTNMGPDSPDSGAESIHPEDALLEEEGDELLIVALDDDDSLSSVSLSEPEEIQDDPEPDVDFDPDLSEPLYVEARIRGLSKALRIGEFIAGVDHITDEQRERIAEILGEFTATQLRNWLRWLSLDNWTGDKLLLFMESWRQWTIRMRDNPNSSYYHQSLSRDEWYEIVHRVDEGNRYDSAEWDDGFA